MLAGGPRFLPHFFPSQKREGAHLRRSSQLVFELQQRVGFDDLYLTSLALQCWVMPKGLRRIQGGGGLHFITCSCYRRLQFLGSASRRNLFLKILEEVRRKYDFVVVGCVVMPEHFHMLISEPRAKPLSVAMQVLKQRVSQKCRRMARKLEKVTATSTPTCKTKTCIGCNTNMRATNDVECKWPGV
jgi:REP element-mobilizing transposase RayT